MTLSHTEWKDHGCETLEILVSTYSTVTSCMAVCFNWKRTIINNGYCGAHQDLFLRLLLPSSSFQKGWLLSAHSCHPLCKLLQGCRELPHPGSMFPPKGWFSFRYTQKPHPLPYSWKLLSKSSLGNIDVK